MTNTVSESLKVKHAELARTELETKQRVYEELKKDLFNGEPQQHMMSRVLRARYARDLARDFHDGGIVRAVEVATAWREIDSVVGPMTLPDDYARARAARSWLYNHEAEIAEVLLLGLGSERDRESIISDLISN